MLENYIYVLVFMGIGLVFGLLPLGLCYILAPRKYSQEKSSAYECGFSTFEDARVQIDVRFYLVAILFIIFDLEIMFLFPWAVVMHKISLTAFLSMGVFLLLLIIGFIYEWKTGALEWE